MPAQIVLVHDEPEFAEAALAALRGAGYDAIAIMDSMSGIDALEHAKHIELLITRVRFPSGTPNGAALARMARLKRPGIKVLFAAFREVQVYTEGLGEFLPRPLSTDELLETVGRMLDEYEDQRGDRPGPPAATERALKPPKGKKWQRAKRLWKCASGTLLKVKSELPDRKQYSKCWRDISIKALPRRRVEFWELYRKACDLHVSIRNGSRMSKAVGRTGRCQTHRTGQAIHRAGLEAEV